MMFICMWDVLIRFYLSLASQWFLAFNSDKNCTYTVDTNSNSHFGAQFLDSFSVSDINKVDNFLFYEYYFLVFSFY